MITMVHQKASFDFQDEYDEYIKSTPVEARFDYLTIEMAVTEAFPKHEAYGMMFSEYHRMRAKLSGYDESEKKRLSFRMPRYYAHVASDLAMANKISIHRTVILLIELGLIHFQVDYASEYSDAKNGRNRLFWGLKTPDDRSVYRQIEKQTIVLESMGSRNAGASIHFIPSVPEWLYNAIMDIRAYLNMSGTDFIFFCWCYGCINCFEESALPDIVRSDIKKVCDEFNFEIKAYSKRINELQYNKQDY
jgi:hypothetical protein